MTPDNEQNKADPEEKAATTNKGAVTESQRRQFSTRDLCYEHASRRKDFKKFDLDSPVPAMSEGERTDVLNLMVESLIAEINSLGNEAEAHTDDDYSIQVLHFIAAFATSKLLEIHIRNRTRLIAFAKTQEMWPVPFGKGALSPEMADNYVKDIGLGKEGSAISPDNILSRETPARFWLGAISMAIRLVRLEAAYIFQRHGLIGADVEGEQMAPLIGADTLPVAPEIYMELKERTSQKLAILFTPILGSKNPFDKHDSFERFVKNALSLSMLKNDNEVIAAWMKVIREFMMDVYDGHPEQSPLREMGMSLAKSKKDLYAEGTPSFESNVRSGMFNEMKSALKSIAKG